jgi:subtilisin-like proprotein convertase family protein
LLGITHTFPQDISVLLQGPQGQQVVLMAAAGGGNDIMEVTLRFEDSATNSLPQYGQIVSGVYRPSNYAPTNYFPGVASLAPPARGSALSAFRRTDPNGDWLLYVVDTQGGDSGMITGGWSLRFVTAPELVVRVVGQNFVISWPDMAGYVVEGSSTLQPGSWQVITASQTVSNGRRSVTIPLASGFKFFRLRQ